jgi:hypothetical protein
MQVHLHDLVSHGSMMVVELATCRVPEGPTTLMPTGGYMVACATFYEQGFGVPSH